MKRTKIFAIYKKEMIDLLRDKKTLIMMVLVPLILYPLIFMGAILVTSAISNQLQSSEYTVILTADDNVEYDRNALITFLEETDDDLNYHLKVIDSTSPKDDLLAEDANVWLNLSMSGEKLDYSIAYLSSVTNSSTASDMVHDKLREYSKDTTIKMLTDAGLSSDLFMEPFTITWSDHSSKEESVGNILGSILPFLLITSILMGAVYPAIDTTSGEKERGTLETLLTIPIKNNELIFGKFLAVSTVTVVSALLNLISMGIMAGFFYSILEESETEMTIDFVSFLPAVLIVILAIIAFALFMSAITMCVTSFAKSFKEANNYITPLLLVVMFTGYIGFIPNIELTALTASIPVVNICLLIKNILVFKYDLTLIFVTLIVSCAYAALSIWFLGKIYNSESILFDEGGVNLQIFTQRKYLKKGGVPTFSDAILVIVFTLLLFLYIAPIVQMKFKMVGLLITQLIILSVPVFAAWYTKKDFKKTFHIRAPKFTQLLGGILLEIATFIVVIFLSIPLMKLFPQDTKGINDTFSFLLEETPFIVALLSIAVAPAICEEALFRGYLFSAARKKFRPAVAILIIAAFFGIYHLSFVKFFTTGILGMVFAYTVMKSESIFVSSLMHFINNGFSVMVTYYGAKLPTTIFTAENPTLKLSDYFLYLGISIVCGTLGILLLNIRKKEITNE